MIQDLSLDSIDDYRRLLQQFNWYHVNEEIRHLYDIEKHRVLTKLELRQLFLLTQIRNQRTYRADPKLDAAML